MTYAQLVAKIRCQAQAMAAGWEEDFAARHDVTPTFVRAMVAGRSPIYPSLVAELAEAVGLRLELVPSGAASKTPPGGQHPTQGSLP